MEVLALAFQELVGSELLTDKTATVYINGLKESNCKLGLRRNLFYEAFGEQAIQDARMKKNYLIVVEKHFLDVRVPTDEEV
jgi:hypothetical protein